MVHDHCWELVILPVVTFMELAFSQVPFIPGVMEKVHKVVGLNLGVLMPL